MTTVPHSCHCCRNCNLIISCDDAKCYNCKNKIQCPLFGSCLVGGPFNGYWIVDERKLIDKDGQTL